LEKTLVCIIGQAREDKYVWDNWKQYLLGPLNADLAVCISDAGIDLSNNLFIENSTYQWIVNEPTDWIAAFDDESRRHYNNDSWKDLLSVPDNWISPLNGSRGAGGILIFFRWLLLENLELSNIFDEYDRVIVTRSDYMFTCPHPPMELLDKKYVWVPNGEHYGGITDRYAVLSKENYRGYLNIFKRMCCDTQDMLNFWSTVPCHQNLEQAVRYTVLSELGEDSVREFPFIMYSIRTEGTETRWAPGYWNDELQCYIKYPTEHALAKQMETIYKTTEDWYNIKF